MANGVVTLRHTGSIGPIKLEFIFVSSPSENDTIQTHLANPVGVTVFTGQTTTNILNQYANLSGKIITIGPTDGDTDLIFLVLGF